MNQTQVKQQLDDVIARYDLLKHPFYQAWSCGHLSKTEIADYAAAYYHHVEAFPRYLESFAKALPEGELKAMVQEHQADEEGKGQFAGQAHGDMWLDFARGMGAERETVMTIEKPQEIENLIQLFDDAATSGSTARALAAFYTYESQTPRVAADKATWLKKWYESDESTCRYFDLHANYDVEHANDWAKCIEDVLEQKPEEMPVVIDQVEKTAKALWTVLDGFEKKRTLQ